MQILLGILFSPALFGIAFLGPLLAQLFIAVGLAPAETITYVIGVTTGALWGAMAQLRGSWIWIKP